MEKHPLILAVDDEESILKLLRVNLSVEGYHVTTASNGILALTLLEEQQPDLVILDIMMPGLDGLQVLALIRQRSSVPVIMLTARYEETVSYDALDLGADDYMRKPFSMQLLAARITAKLRRANQSAWNSSGDNQ